MQKQFKTEKVEYIYLQIIIFNRKLFLIALAYAGPSDKFLFFEELWQHVKGNTQKQPFRDFLKKRHSGNMQQIYRRTLMPRCDFNKDFTSALVFTYRLAAYFQNTFF